MNIILGSKNLSKKRSVEMALEELGIKDINIICIDSPSLVNSKPVGYEVIRGADNRNKFSKKYAEDNGIEFDYIIAIEGGFSINESGHPFVATYAIVEDNTGKKSTGKSMEIRLKKEVFNYIRDGGSLNRIIGDITDKNNNKQNLGIMGYLTDGLLKRDEVDKQAVMSAMVSFLYEERMKILCDNIDE